MNWECGADGGNQYMMSMRVGGAEGGGGLGAAMRMAKHDGRGGSNRKRTIRRMVRERSGALWVEARGVHCWLRELMPGKRQTSNCSCGWMCFLWAAMVGACNRLTSCALSARCRISKTLRKSGIFYSIHCKGGNVRHSPEMTVGMMMSIRKWVNNCNN
jgi:hypothetical protein